MAERSKTRSTRQRKAVRAALETADRFLSAQELHDAMRAGGETISLATIYRTLQHMADADQVDVLRAADSDEAIYRRCSTSEHHHHLVCRNCGAAVEVESDEIERWAAREARRHGFTSVEHLAEIYGLCEACA